MIRKINNIYYLSNPLANGSDSATSSSLSIVALSSLAVSANTINVGDGFKVKTLFRKGTASATNYNVFLYWNTGSTYDANAIKLAEVSVGGSTSAIGLERHFYPTFGAFPFTPYVDSLDVAALKESDTGSNLLEVVGGGTYNFNSGGYYLACAQRTGLTKTPDEILCSYIYLDIY